MAINETGTESTLRMAKTCEVCGVRAYSDRCVRHKVRKPIAVKAALPKPTKRIKQVGKVQKATSAYVEAWKRTQKPNHQGYYTCYISGTLVPYLMAEHPYSKTRHPDKRTNQKLEPVSAEINKLKGSMDIHDFLAKYPEFKATVKPEYLAE